MLDKRPLRSSTFRHLAAGYWVNELGNWFGEIALAILVFDRTRSALATATLFLALRFLPALLAPLLTVRVEALAPRITLPCLYVLEGAFFAGMALLAHHFSLPGILALSALDGMLAIAAKALTRGVSATWLLKREMLREGNAILNLGAMVSMAVGPALSGAAVAWKGASTALIVDAATFVVTAGIIASARELQLETDQTAGFKGRVRAGIDVLRDYAAVRRLLVAVAFVFLLGSIPVPIEVVFAKQTLHAGDRGYGFLLGAWGVGTVVGAGAFATLGQMRLMRLLAISTVLTVLGYAGLALSPTLAVACLFSVLGGSGNGAGWIAAVTAVQERIPVATQSAVMSVLEGINQLMPAVGFIIGGAITAATSPRDAYALSALGVTVVIFVIGMRPIDRARLSPVSKDLEQAADTSGCTVEKNSFSSVKAQELMPTARTLPVTDL
jgi:Transmembrane secretion effector